MDYQLFSLKYNEKLGIDVIHFSKKDGNICPEMYSAQFDKVLCDVPCFSDRLMIFDEEHCNLFQDHRAKERLQLPELQMNLLR